MDSQISQPLSKAERREIKKEENRREQQLEKRKNKLKKLLFTSAWILGAIILVFIIGFVVSSQKVLPPTTMAGHIEVSPESHFLTQPMDIRVHKHMLEHADGSGPPGIIINYNCTDFDCEPDFLGELKRIIDQYPDRVYVAPFPRMGAKLVITSLGRQEIFEELNRERIKDFIEKVVK